MRALTILYVMWLPSRRSLAEAIVASLGLLVQHASGCFRLTRVARPYEIFHRKDKRSEVLVDRRRAIRRATPNQTAGGSAKPPSLAFCPSELPVKNLDRTSGPKAATEASAIRAAVWQPKSYLELDKSAVTAGRNFSMW